MDGLEHPMELVRGSLDGLDGKVMVYSIYEGRPQKVGFEGVSTSLDTGNIVALYCTYDLDEYKERFAIGGDERVPREGQIEYHVHTKEGIEDRAIPVFQRCIRLEESELFLGNNDILYVGRRHYFETCLGACKNGAQFYYGQFVDQALVREGHMEIVKNLRGVNDARNTQRQPIETYSQVPREKLPEYLTRNFFIPIRDAITAKKPEVDRYITGLGTFVAGAHFRSALDNLVIKIVTSNPRPSDAEISRMAADAIKK